MIFVVEVPAAADPSVASVASVVSAGAAVASAWFAFDLDDLLLKIERRAPGAVYGGAAGAASADAAAAEGGPQCRIFWTEAEAMAAFERASDPLWQGDGWRARLALRDQLVALDVLADDL